MPNDKPPPSPLLSYEIDGSILTLRASGTPTTADRQPVYDAVRADARVPNDARLLLDIREIDVAMYGEHAVVERFRVLFDQLGLKLGPACAMLVPPGLADRARMFQEAASEFGLQVRIFTDEPSARQWLTSYR
jgi:hypothetical protein